MEREVETNQLLRTKCARVLTKDWDNWRDSQRSKREDHRD